MCDLYAGVDSNQYQKVSRSIRLNGHVTSLSLENRFWILLDEMATAENITVVQFISTLYLEVLDRYGEFNNFTSLLRVACTTFLMNQREDQGYVPVNS